MIDGVPEDGISAVSESFVDGEVTCKVTDLVGNGVMNTGDFFELTPSEAFTIGYAYMIELTHVTAGGPLAAMSFTWVG